MRCIQRIYPGESNCENVNDKCNHPTFRWNVIATRACCLSGRHLSIVGDDEAAFIEVFIEVRRAKTISRPDLFCTAGLAFQLAKGGRTSYKSDMISTLCQSANQPTITRFHYQYPIKCSSSIVEFAPKIPSCQWWPWCTWCQPHVSCLTLSCPIVQRD